MFKSWIRRHTLRMLALAALVPAVIAPLAVLSPVAAADNGANITGFVASAPVASGGANEYNLYLLVTGSTVPGVSAGQQVWLAASMTDFPHLAVGATLTGSLERSLGWWVLKPAASPTTPVVTPPPAASQPQPISVGMQPLAMVYYGPHSATIDADIASLRPEILIDNTPAGLWRGNCNSAWFQARGTKVFSYIDGSYSSRDLYANLAYIDAIAAEGTYGVFLDQARPSVDSYLQAIYARCQQRGVKLMINPGMPNIDANLYSYADYVMTDEHYQGRAPSAAEAGHLSQTVVIGFTAGVSAQQAAAWSNAAWANGFRYTWEEQLEYTVLPARSWLDAYAAGLSR